MDYFGRLFDTGDPSADVPHFLLKAGRPDTLAHCQAVAVQARELAARFGLDEERAALAALCHDLAAVVSLEDAIAVADHLGLSPAPAERESPILLHGPIAAAVLEQALGLADQDLLNAIRYHSTCRAGATDLELLLFVADKIALDPAATTRDFVPAVRTAAKNSLAEAAWAYLDWVVTNGPRLGWRLHPNVLAAYAELGAKSGQILFPGAKKIKGMSQ